MRQYYPLILLTISNIFMTFAWYGHLKFKSTALWVVILASWGIAFFEYCFQVPANRIGHEFYSAAQLKIMQEAITIIIFLLFFGLVSERRFEMELSGWLCPHITGRIFRFQKLVP